MHGHRAVVYILTALALGSGIPSAQAAPPARTGSAKIHPELRLRATRAAADAPVKAWIFFSDKGTPDRVDRALRNVAREYSVKTIERRIARRTRPGLFDEHDLPVHLPYIEAVTQKGPALHVESRWLNAISVYATLAQLEQVADLPFVRSMEPVRRGRRVRPPLPPEPIAPAPVAQSPTVEVPLSGGGLDYGASFDQLNQIGVVDMHALGFTGLGIVIGVLDTGFTLTHIAFHDPVRPLTVIASYDFVDDDPNVGIELGDANGQANHGTQVLGTMAGYKSGDLIGAAYDASYILCKTEDLAAEYPAEEDNFVAGLEFIEANGGDIATASLGYIDWYTQADLDGLTAVTTVAVNIATGNGLVCLNAAGNYGNDTDPATSTLIAPADALQVITCGAVANTGLPLSFSSDGPTADGRVKPEVMARGLLTRTVSTTNDLFYSSVNGTSFATPLVAGAVALLVQAHPDWTVDQLRNRLFFTADYFVANGTFDPLYVSGYGVINALSAHQFQDCNFNGVIDGADVANGTSNDVDGNLVPDECQIGACCTCGAGGTCIDTELDTCTSWAGFLEEGVDCLGVTCPAPIPAQDECLGAIPAGSVLDTRCATTGAGPDTSTGDCNFFSPDTLGHDVWLTYVADCTGHLSVDASGAGFDAYVAVYCNGTATCPCPTDDSLEYTCAYEGIEPADEILVRAGRCYLLRIGSIDGGVGVGDLNINCDWWACPAATAPQIPVGEMAKNRMLSLEVPVPGAQAIRVTMAAMPAPLDVLNGTQLWVGVPEEVSQNPAFADPAEGGGSPTMHVAPLQCDPHLEDWSAWGTLHLHDPLIVPGATYDVQTIGACGLDLAEPKTCFEPASIETYFSAATSISTSAFGDVVGTCAMSPCSAPDGEVGIPSDLTAVLDTFRSWPTAAGKARSDLFPEALDFVVSILDVTAALDAFRGEAYLDIVPPPPCLP